MHPTAVRPRTLKGSNSSRFDCYKLGDLVVKCGFWTRLASHILAIVYDSIGAKRKCTCTS